MREKENMQKFKLFRKWLQNDYTPQNQWILLLIRMFTLDFKRRNIWSYVKLLCFEVQVIIASYGVYTGISNTIGFPRQLHIIHFIQWIFWVGLILAREQERSVIEKCQKK